MQTFGLEHFLPFRWMPPANPWRKETYSKPVRTRLALEELGTTFVKVGQILSTRTDILPSDYTGELAKLQNALKPLGTDIIDRVITYELGKPTAQVFRSFDAIPIGVASIGQAHAAVLQDGTEVIVKIRKPGVIEQVAEDLDILRHLAASAGQNLDASQPYDLPGIIEEIADTLMAEMDYIREGHNAEHFAKFFQGDSSVHIPKVFWEYTTSQVIVLERIRGIGILDLPKIDAAGFDRKELAERSVNIWVKMVFEDTVYHADPHPGNLFIEADGRLGLVDFGMVGFIDEEVRDNLSNAVKAILDRDANLLVDSLSDLGAVPRADSKQNLKKDLKHIMGHYPLSLEELDLSSNLGELFNVVRRNHIQLPGNTFLLLKTMTMAQSLGIGLNPDFDFFLLLKPNVDWIIKKKYSPYSVMRRLPPTAADFAIFGAGLPKQLSKIVKSIERGEMHIRTDVPGIERHIEHLEKLVNRIVLGLLASAVIFAVAIIIQAYILNH